MTDHPRTPSDPELASLLAAVADDIDTQLGDGTAAPDFLAVVTRAHALDNSVISREDVEEVSSYAAIVSLARARRVRAARGDKELDEVVDDVRSATDQALTAEQLRPRSRPRRAPKPTRRWPWAVGVAAVVTAAFGLGVAGRFHSRDSAQADQRQGVHEAAMVPRDTVDPTPSARQRTDGTSPKRQHAASPESGPEQAPDAVESPSESPAEIPAGPPSVAKAQRRPPPRESLAMRLKRLDAEANAAWANGQLDEASGLFALIAKLDRGGRLAETAYGDLFTLLRQQKKSEVPMWRAYLKRFPKGRFADDARAGLCRAAPESERRMCWMAYLEQMPKGSFRALATREVERR